MKEDRKQVRRSRKLLARPVGRTPEDPPVLHWDRAIAAFFAAAIIMGVIVLFLVKG